MQEIDGFTLGDAVVVKRNPIETGTIVRLIPAVEGRGYMDHAALARVRWPDRRRLGGSGYRHTTIALASLQHEER
jgi:hypothetical protein